MGFLALGVNYAVAHWQFLLLILKKKKILGLKSKRVIKGLCTRVK